MIIQFTILQIYQSLTRHLRYVHSLDKQKHDIRQNFKKENHQNTLNKDNNFELQELNYCSMFCSNKNLQASS